MLERDVDLIMGKCKLHVIPETRKKHEILLIPHHPIPNKHTNAIFTPLSPPPPLISDKDEAYPVINLELEVR